METLAAGLLASGLALGDRILICGSNHSAAYVSTFACARAGLVFCLASPNIQTAAQLERMLQMVISSLTEWRRDGVQGDFRAIICFRSNIASDHLNDLLLQFAPELRQSIKGQLQSKVVPKLTHVILADEDHKHA